MAELCWINRNMRCIEMLQQLALLNALLRINRNMRCIEIFGRWRCVRSGSGLIET